MGYERSDAVAWLEHDYDKAFGPLLKDEAPQAERDRVFWRREEARNRLWGRVMWAWKAVAWRS